MLDLNSIPPFDVKAETEMLVAIMLDTFINGEFKVTEKMIKDYDGQIVEVHKFKDGTFKLKVKEVNK